jgi:cytosine/adenosine deaminase-related metal-dependent hydrolase
MDETLITAAWVAPIHGPVLRDAAIVFRDGQIVAVGSIQSLCAKYPSAVIHDAGNAIILPGLVNAHTHLELSSLVQRKPPARFVDWIIGLMGQTGSVDWRKSVEAGIQQCLRFGVTSVGDITSQPMISREILKTSPLRGVSYGEVRAMGQRRAFLESRLSAAIDSDSQKSREVPPRTGAARHGSVEHFVNGISPHAPYSIEIDGYKKCLSAAGEFGLPLATHLAETPDEAMFLADHTGPFKALWDLLAAWDEHVPRFTGGPVRFAKAIGLLDYPTLLAHVNYCDDAEMDLLAGGCASVVYCPRTHEYFGHPPHRWREMLARGINVALGTDSCGSSPDLNLVEDLRLIHRIAPEIDPLILWHMATVSGAKAIGSKNAGSLTAGHSADLTIFTVKTNDPLLEIIEQPRLPAQVWIAGRLVRADTESA